MSTEEMLQRATLVFVGVIETHQFDSWPFLRLDIPGRDPQSSKYWKILRRQVRIETVLRGVESRRVIDVYEIFWTGGATGDWNSTQNGERALFLVRKEGGRYHLVRDWWRSIFPVTGGPREVLPLDDSHALWERIALMNWWVRPNDPTARVTYPYLSYNDPGRALSGWRVIKLERGLLRHPSPSIRVAACRALLLADWGQDECWEMLSDADRAHLSQGGYVCCLATEISARRAKARERGAESQWRDYSDREHRRLLTAINNAQLRREFCHLWEDAYPGDHDNGCPPDRPPPATIVTERGDVPLTDGDLSGNDDQAGGR